MLNRYTGNSRIVGSNPIPSATVLSENSKKLDDRVTVLGPFIVLVSVVLWGILRGLRMSCNSPAGRIFPQGIIEISRLDVDVLQLWVSHRLCIGTPLLFYRRCSQVEATAGGCGPRCTLLAG